MKKYNIAVIGGDMRLAYLKQYLEEEGYGVIGYAVQNTEDSAESMEQAVKLADVIVGGIPFAKGGAIHASRSYQDMKLSDFFRCLEDKGSARGGCKLIAGAIPREFRQQLEQIGIVCYDFMEEEAIAIYNTIATAEGAVLEALKGKDTNIHQSQSLVLGYGRCGKVLCEKLKGLSARVTLSSADSQELSYAEAFGIDTLPLSLLEKKIQTFEYIYNTIPAVVLGDSILRNVSKEVLIIDIASGTGGVDYTAAEAIGIQAVHCLGLPGKYAAKSSADILTGYVRKKVLQT